MTRSAPTTTLVGVVYLVHFTRPYRHARHYTGWTADRNSRLAEHQAGRGARLLAVITQAGIDWTLARTWPAPAPANASSNDKAAHRAAARSRRDERARARAPR